MKAITSFVFILAGILLVGCSQTQDNAKLDALSQKLDTILQNQAAINARLDELPKTVSAIGHYYSTNETAMIYVCHTNILNAMAGQEDSIEATINKEVRRVGAGEEKLLEVKINQAVNDIQTNFIGISADLKMVKIKLGIPDF